MCVYIKCTYTHVTNDSDSTTKTHTVLSSSLETFQSSDVNMNPLHAFKSPPKQQRLTGPRNHQNLQPFVRMLLCNKNNNNPCMFTVIC